MEQKLFVVKYHSDCKGEVEFPEELQNLLAEGWKITQISAYGYATNVHQNKCVLLLQRECPPLQ